MRALLSVVGALSALQLVSVVAQEPPTCMARCTSEVRGEFTKFGCTNAEDKACLCPKADFHNGIRDCAQAGCGATTDNVNTFLSSDYCAGFSPPAGAPSSSSAAPESSAPPPSSSEPPAPSSSAPPPETTTSQAPETTSTAPTTTTTSQPAESSAPASTSTTNAPESTTSTTEPATTNAQSTSTSPSSSSSSSSSTSTSAPTDGAAKDENEKDSDTEAAAGLTAAAKAGIAVGVIAAVLVGAALAWFLLRKRKPQAARPVEISKPISGSRGGYGNSDDQYEKYGDIEMTTRYEDMLPRQQPRTMV